MYTLIFFAIIGLTSFGQVRGLGIRPFGSNTTVGPLCSTEQRMSGVGCPCSLINLPCSAGSNAICSRASSGGSQLTCRLQALTIQNQFIYVVGTQDCAGDREFNLACGGSQPITCSLTFLNATTSGGSYSGSPAFLNVVNPSTGCSYVTAGSVGPAQDIYVCYTATCTDSARSTATGAICTLILKPDPKAVCPATPTSALAATQSGVLSFIPGCTDVSTVVGTIQGTGGTGPYTYSLALTGVTGLSTTDVAAYKTQFPTGALQINTSTGRLTLNGVSIDKSVVLTYTVTVTDSAKATTTTTFTVTAEGTPATCG